MTGITTALRRVTTILILRKHAQVNRLTELVKQRAGICQIKKGHRPVVLAQLMFQSDQNTHGTKWKASLDCRTQYAQEKNSQTSPDQNDYSRGTTILGKHTHPPYIDVPTHDGFVSPAHPEMQGRQQCATGKLYTLLLKLKATHDARTIQE